MERKKIIEGLYRKAQCEITEDCEGCPYDPAVCAKTDDRRLLLEAARLLELDKTDRGDEK